MMNGLTPEASAQIAAINAVSATRRSLRAKENINLALTPELLSNPVVFAAFITLVEAIAAETGIERPFN